MHHNSFFSRSRLYLSSFYAGVMGLILGLASIGIYQLVAWERWQALDQEMHTLSVTLHDAIEPMLKQPGQLEPRVAEILPGLCLKDSNCSSAETVPRIHTLGVVQQSGYSVQLFNQQKGLIASAGQPDFQVQLQQVDSQQHLISAPDGQRYHLVSLQLKTQTGQVWGYLSVGRSLKSYDTELEHLRFYLILGYPGLLLLITLVSWLFVGLSMHPVYHSYQRIQQFTADAAHELRTPLAAIQATVEAALHEDTPAAEMSYTLQTVARQNRRLNQLTNDLLFLSRLDLKISPTKQEACNLNDILSDVTEEFSALALTGQVQLYLSCPNTPLSLVGNQEQLYRLIINLVSNALHHTPAGGKILLKLSQAGQQAVLVVADTGVGITLMDQQKIFDRFYRISHDRSRKSGGSGLGLAIAQAIVAAHQGSIQVQSEVGKGSVFTVRLPLLAGKKRAPHR